MCALNSREHDDLMRHFEREFKHRRLTREKDRELWKTGNIYEDGHVNETFLTYRRGYALAKAIYTAG